MPISFASNATASRILSARRPSVTSALGRAASVKVILQDELGGNLVARTLALPAAGSGLAQRIGSAVGRKSLVAELDWNRKLALELPTEALRTRSHRVRNAIGMRGQPHHEQCGMPFRDQRRDLSQPFVASRRSDRGQWMGESRACFPDGHADALGTEVERKNSPR